MHSDQMRKYGISESTIQALYYDIAGNKVIIRACIMYSEMPYFLSEGYSTWSVCLSVCLSMTILYRLRGGL